MKVVIPMAGDGRRFADAGYIPPKPLIDVAGKPMIQAVVENLGFDCEYVFIVRDEHLRGDAGLLPLLNRITAGRFQYVVTDGCTEGAACSVLLAARFIDRDEDIVIANSDQLIEHEPQNFLALARRALPAGIVFTFRASEPKWSFVRLDGAGAVVEVAEKRPISNVATCGIYWYRRGADFVRCARRMIEKNLRVNNEFYVAPVYNELIAQRDTVLPYFVHRMQGLGTPEDLRAYLKEAVPC